MSKWILVSAEMSIAIFNCGHGQMSKGSPKGGGGSPAPLEYFRRFHHWRKLYNVSRQSLHAMPQYIRSLHEWRRIAREDDSGGSHPHGLGLLGGHRTSDHRSSNETTGGFDSRLGRVILGNNKIQVYSLVVFKVLLQTITMISSDEQ